MPEDNPSPLGYGDSRTQFAAERTLLAWVRTGMALMGFGFVVARFGLFLRELATVHGAAFRGPLLGGAPKAGAALQNPAVQNPAAFPLPSSQTFGVSMWVGITLIVLGVAVSLLAAGQHWTTVRRLDRGEPLRFRAFSLGVLLAVALAIIGLVLAAYLTVGLRQGP